MKSKAYKILLKSNISRFIRENQNADVKKLALKKPPDPAWPMPLILDQINALQKAKVKIPLWFEGNKNLLMPSAQTIEQASSQATAFYKARLIEGKSFVDLTAGAGFDTFAFAQHFKSGLAIEKDTNSADILEHNIEQLGLNHIKIENVRAEDFIEDMPATDLVYIDPARRTKDKKGEIQLKSASPNILDMRLKLLEKSKKVLIKTSPMLDIDKAIKDLEYVESVHILQYQNECKEVLYILSPHAKTEAATIPLTAVNLDDNGNPHWVYHTTKQRNEKINPQYAAPQTFLYEPSSAIQKLGLFGDLAEKYSLKKLAPNTHLFTSCDYVENFPGRIFEIKNIYPAQKSSLPMKKANLTVRNFPMSAPALRKKLKLKDGGKEYLFACEITGSDKKYALIHAQKPRLRT